MQSVASTSLETGQTVDTKTRILVVEDDVASRNALRMLLRHSGFDGAYAGTVAEGLALLQWEPAAIILDLMLPDGNGASILQYIRSKNLPIRVAVATGVGDLTAMIDVPRLQPDVVFRKPLDFNRLLAWLTDAT